MNTPERAHELYQTMVGKTGKFTIEFNNMMTYEIPSLSNGTHHWDHEARKGHAELHTKRGKILFEFSQVKKIK